MSDLSTVQSTRVVLDNVVTAAAVIIDGAGRIAEIRAHGDTAGAVDDAGDLVVMPALIDTHVHVNEPGRTDWEGFATATRAAAAGGVAALIDMPLNSIPPTTTLHALEVKREAAAAAAGPVDVGFWGGIVPGSLDHVPDLIDAGVFGFKAFLVESGVDEFPCIGAEDLAPALEAIGDLPLLVHAEAPGPIAGALAAGPGYASYLASRPPEAEIEAVRAVIDAVAHTGGWAHILHLSAAGALPLLAEAKAADLPITVETCPHYLAITAEVIPDDACEFKCAPPIRDEANRDALWSGLQAGVIDMIVSDHSPCPADLKEGGFAAAWGGIASLELRLSVVWTEAAQRGHEVPDLAGWLCRRPAELAGLDSGRIAASRRADLVVWDPDAEFEVDAGALEQRHPVSPYDGRTLRGVIHRTYRAGRRIDRDALSAADPGNLLVRS